MSAIRFCYQWERFFYKDSACELQSKLFKASPLKLFFFVLIVYYIALLTHVLSYSKVVLLLLFFYLV